MEWEEVGKGGGGEVGGALRLKDLVSSLLQVPQLICGPAEPDTPLTIVESPPPACVEPGVRGQQPAGAGECKDTPTGNRKCFTDILCCNMGGQQGCEGTLTQCLVSFRPRGSAPSCYNLDGEHAVCGGGGRGVCVGRRSSQTKEASWPGAALLPLPPPRPLPG